MRHVRWLMFSLVIITTACSTLPPIEDTEAIGHILSIDRDGVHVIIEADKPIVKNPGLEKASMAASNFDPIFKGISAYPPNENGEIEVLIYIHGGLNTQKTAQERVLEKYKLIKYAQSENKYPIFINWRSGPFTTYGDHLYRIRHGDIDKWAKGTAPLYFFTDTGITFATAPKAWAVSALHSYDATFFRDDDYLEPFKGGVDGILYTGSEEDYSNALRATNWIVTGIPKIFTTPFVYTLGRPAWDMMLRRTNTPFYTPADFKIDDQEQFFETSLKPGTGALYRFLLELEQKIKTDNLKVKITLIGHSMGAIIVNKMLNLNIDLPYDNIVHMASADSINNLLEHVVPYLIDKPEVNFYSLSLHPENEDRERNAWGFVPSGSLLVWVDEMYSTPETLLSKRSGRWENMRRAVPLIPANARRNMHFKIFGLYNDFTQDVDGNEFVVQPQKHGDFGDMRFWLRETWWE